MRTSDKFQVASSFDISKTIDLYVQFAKMFYNVPKRSFWVLGPTAGWHPKPRTDDFRNIIVFLLTRNLGTLKSDIVSRKHQQCICTDLKFSNWKFEDWNYGNRPWRRGRAGRKVRAARQGLYLFPDILWMITVPGDLRRHSLSPTTAASVCPSRRFQTADHDTKLIFVLIS